jgi:hypothetical protein
MEMMYNMSVQIHYGLVFVWMGVILFNAAMVQFAVAVPAYVRRARIFMPMSVMTLFALAFTGAIMMAAKHLDFTPENVAMIVLVVVLTVMESRRYKTMRRLRVKVADALEVYRPYALKLLGVEGALTLAMTGWMAAL